MKTTVDIFFNNLFFCLAKVLFYLCARKHYLLQLCFFFGGGGRGVLGTTIKMKAQLAASPRRTWYPLPRMRPPPTLTTGATRSTSSSLWPTCSTSATTSSTRRTGAGDISTRRPGTGTVWWHRQNLSFTTECRKENTKRTRGRRI